jgi:hypothetical protein
MRSLCLAAAMLLLSAAQPARSESAWLESGRLDPAEIRALCARVSDARLLARMQMISAGDARWRLLARQELVIEEVRMGAAPLDPERCYAIARAGAEAGRERRAFEVRDFAASAERTSILLVGRHHASPPAP